MKRAVYDKLFRMAAVKHAQSTDQSVSEVAKTLGIRGSALRGWINEYDQYGESAFPGHGNALFNSTYEVKKLQKQIEDLKLENEILKNSRPSGRKRLREISVSERTSEKYNIKKACKILKVSRSGYYDYLNRRKSNRAIENEALEGNGRSKYTEA